VPEGDGKDAWLNIEVFVRDLDAKGFGIPQIKRSPELDDGDGRHTFTLTWEGYAREVQMPDLDLERVRWMGLPGQNIWDFPRLCVDGSSWVWQFALKACDVDEDA
jgi:hypothetical protein